MIDINNIAFRHDLFKRRRAAASHAVALVRRFGAPITVGNRLVGRRTSRLGRTGHSTSMWWSLAARWTVALDLGHMRMN